MDHRSACDNASAIWRHHVVRQPVHGEQHARDVAYGFAVRLDAVHDLQLFGVVDDRRGFDYGVTELHVRNHAGGGSCDYGGGVVGDWGLLGDHHVDDRRGVFIASVLWGHAFGVSGGSGNVAHGDIDGVGGEYDLQLRGAVFERQWDRRVSELYVHYAASSGDYGGEHIVNHDVIGHHHVDYRCGGYVAGVLWDDECAGNAVDS